MRLSILNFIFLPLISFAQQPQASISKKEVEIGGRVDLIYKVELDKNDRFDFKPINGTFPAKLTLTNASLKTADFNDIEITLFEDSMIRQGNKKIWIGVYELTPWDSGLVVLEGQRFMINDSTFDFPSVYLQCNLIPHVKGQGLYDIKEHFAKTPEKQSWIVFFLKIYFLVVTSNSRLLNLSLFRYKKEFHTSKTRNGIILESENITSNRCARKSRVMEKRSIKRTFCRSVLHSKIVFDRTIQFEFTR